jgi:predicted dehydrogenase
MYVLPLLREYSGYGQVVSFLDIDLERVRLFNEIHAIQIPVYTPDDFDRMIVETRPEKIIVASPDVSHVEYIVKALQHNLHVLVEKPMVTNCQQLQRVMVAEQQSKGKLQVAFNFRYLPANILIKKLILDNMLGRITNIEFIYNVDIDHGSSYFYRWNRDRELSGGLSITKGCHHFDLISWWLNDIPQQAFAYGGLNYYGSNSPYSPAKKEKKNSSVEEQIEDCPYYKHQRLQVDHSNTESGSSFIANQRSRGLPYTVQYPKDRVLYIYDEEISIEDTYSAVIRYKGGASVTYSANFSAPWEGYILGINGTKGRIETIYYSDSSHYSFSGHDHQVVTYYPLFGERQVYKPQIVSGRHGGADTLLQHDIFIDVSPERREFDLTADSVAGGYAVATGEAIWRSIQTNCPVFINELLPNLTYVSHPRAR